MNAPKRDRRDHAVIANSIVISLRADDARNVVVAGPVDTC